MSIPSIFKEGSSPTVQEWEHRRRPEILRLFEEHVYGATPKELPDCEYTVTRELKGLGDDNVTMQEIYARFERKGKSCGFHSRMFLPDDRKAPAPVVIMINPFSHNESVSYPGREHDHMPYELIAEHGYIAVHADVDEACLDDPDRYRSGLLELYPSEGESGWGAIGGWAFCTSRLVDYLVTRKEADASRIAVCGCSRAGKTALWCAAQDSRIAMTVSVESGCTGAAITRGKTGEHIRDITGQFPHWMCRKYASYSNDEEKLPVDQHMLLALCAPRPLYVSSASRDDWADPKKEFEACLLASEVFELYGKEGLKGEKFPDVNSPVVKGSMGYHVRKGIHGCRVYDWLQYLSFMDGHFKTQPGRPVQPVRPGER